MLSKTFTAVVATLAAMAPAALAAKEKTTFAVLRFHGPKSLTSGRSDPIVNPGKASTHVHHIQGGNAFGNSATGKSMQESTCSTANIKNDNSAYWMPSVYFHDKANNSFEAVPIYYMNVYYFFEESNDDIQAFPVGLQMISGDVNRRTAPHTGNIVKVQGTQDGDIQPAQFTCPRQDESKPLYPVGSDGSVAGIQDTSNKGAGAGFPFENCDGVYSPLRADLHFPSCYDPSKGLTDYKSNMAFPTDAGNGKVDCPEGWIHTPHLFYEMYWDTPAFEDRWTPGGDSQPFVLSNGDSSGYSLHGDFLAGWDEDVLQHIIDTCDAGTAGMDKCPGVEPVLEGDCAIANPSPEDITGPFSSLPGDNALFGWAVGDANDVSSSSSGSSSISSTSTSETSESTSSATSESTSSATSESTEAAIKTVRGNAKAKAPKKTWSSTLSSSKASVTVPLSTAASASSATSATSATSASSASTSSASSASSTASLSSPSTLSTKVATSTPKAFSSSAASFSSLPPYANVSSSASKSQGAGKSKTTSLSDDSTTTSAAGSTPSSSSDNDNDNDDSKTSVAATATTGAADSDSTSLPGGAFKEKESNTAGSAGSPSETLPACVDQVTTTLTSVVHETRTVTVIPGGGSASGTITGTTTIATTKTRTLVVTKSRAVDTTIAGSPSPSSVPLSTGVATGGAPVPTGFSNSTIYGRDGNIMHVRRIRRAPGVSACEATTTTTITSTSTTTRTATVVIADSSDGPSLSVLPTVRQTTTGTTTKTRTGTATQTTTVTLHRQPSASTTSTTSTPSSSSSSSSSSKTSSVGTLSLLPSGIYSNGTTAEKRAVHMHHHRHVRKHLH